MDERSSCSSSDMVWIKDLLEPPTHRFAGESRYLTQLHVSGNGSRSDSFQSAIHPHNHKIQDMVRAALKLLVFREQHVVVQFWSPCVSGKHQILTAMNQPFGLGVTDEILCLYMKYSVRTQFVLDKIPGEEEDVGPPARVYRQELPEWTCDVTNYDPKDFPLRDCAIRCNLHGYLALPVFDSTTWLCVGVLELLMSSKYTSYAYEVRQVHTAFKTVDLTTPQAFDRPTSNVHNKHRRNELEKILSILKVMCDIHRLPLAQTWAVSPFSSLACQEQILVKSCNSFDTMCLGKVCMSTAALPFHVQDLGMWPFLKACRERHLDNSRGFVGRALLSRGSIFCEDVTKLSEEEYPLVRNACMSKLTSCFAIFLHSFVTNSEYVLEFFLPLHMEGGRYLPTLMQTLKQNSDVAAGFEWGDESYIQVGPSTEISSLSLSRDPHSIQLSPIVTTKTKIFEMVSSDSESNVANVSKTVSTNVQNRWSPKQKYPRNCGSIITSTNNLGRDEVIRDNINVAGARKNDNTIFNPNMSKQKTSDAITDAEEKSNHPKQDRKRKTDSLTLEAGQKHIGIPIGEAAINLDVGRSTSKPFCREHNIPHWPVPKLHNKKSSHVPSLQLSSNIRFSIYVVVLLLLGVKRWSCSRKHHGFSGRWWSCGKHRNLPCKSDFIYLAAFLMVHSKRWRNKISIKHAMQNRDQHAECESTLKPKYTTNIINSCLHTDWQLAKSNLVQASPKQSLANVLDTKTAVTVKATYKDDIIKFLFQTSWGLSELEKEVLQRIEVNGRKLRLKYKDEDDDMILLACDTDLRHLLRFSGGDSIVKLSVLVTDD